LHSGARVVGQLRIEIRVLGGPVDAPRTDGEPTDDGVAEVKRVERVDRSEQRSTYLG
jgi:hypothetical protein